MSTSHPGRLIASGFALGLLCACSRESSTTVTYSDVKPIFEQYCVSCHKPGQPGYETSGLSLQSYDEIMKGTHFGPVVLPGDPRTSALMMLIEGRADPSIRMPHGDAPKPAKADIDRIRAWIEGGAKPG
jgi:hypothetical protein